MAVGSRNAVFTFKADISNYVQNGAVLIRTNNGIRKSAQDVSTTLQTTDRQIKTTGQTAASSAVNFQTMTQGMLNLSTAGAQTFTSLSNLDRAANRLMQAQVAQQRGVDLLRNKELRLAQLREKGGADLRKIAALESEVETARADLLVKTDKLRIEEGALNDVRILFVTNIANVMISSLQTINTLRTMEIRQTITSAGAKIKDAFAARIMTQAYSKAPAAINATRFSLRGLLLTLGPIGLAITGIGVAMQAWEENWGGFRDTLQSVFPFLRDLEKDVLPGVRNETDDLINSVGDLDDGYSKLGNNLSNNLVVSFEDATKAVVRFNQFMKESKKTADDSIKSIESFMSKTAEFHGLGAPTVILEDKKKADFFDQLIELIFPSAAAEEFKKVPIISPGKIREDIPTGFEVTDISFLGREPTTTLLSDEQIARQLGVSTSELDVFIKATGISANQLLRSKQITSGDFLGVIESIKTKKFETELTQIAGATPQEFLNLQEMQRKIQEAKKIDENFAQAFREEFTTKPTKMSKFIPGLQVGESIDKILFSIGKLETERAKKFELRQTLVDVPGVGKVQEEELEDVLLAGSLRDKLALGGEFDFAGIAEDELEDVNAQQYIRFLAAKKGIGESITLNKQEQRIFEKLKSGEITGNRALVAIAEGIDIGAFANSVSQKEAVRIGILEKELSQFNARGGQFIKPTTPLNIRKEGGARVDDWLARTSRGQQLGFITPEASAIRDANMRRKMQFQQASLGGRAAEAIAAVGGNATLAFQVAEGSIKVPAWVREERAKFMAYMHSPEGVADIINRRRNQFASDFYFERYAGGESPITQRQSRAISGYFAPGEADKALFKAIIGREVSGLPVGVQALMKIRRAFTEPTRGPGGHAFQTFMKRMGERHRQQNTFLRTAVTRFEGGNFGEFEATSLYGLSSHTANVLSSEIDSEQRVFQERFGTPLGMDYNTFAQVMSTAQRGLSEMEDRLRWNQRLDSISTGATVI